MTAARRWGAAIAGLLLVNVAAASLLLIFAHGATESRVIPDYYTRGLEHEAPHDFWKLFTRQGSR
jgi:hypothetical protein